MKETENQRWWEASLVCLLLAVTVVATYWPVRNNGFVDFDDPQYLAGNPHVRRGLTLDDTRWVFAHFYFNNYHPLTLLSHASDVQFFGMNPRGHHVMNLALHVANSLLLFLLLRRMTSTLWPSAFVAAAFALHPLHVESVAWVAERKDVLSTLFWLLTMLAYFAYVRRPGIGRYLLVILLFALGLLSKPMLVTLPFVLLLLDYWPLKRPVPWWRLALEKAPLLLMALASSIITVLAQGEAVVETKYVPLAMRVALIPVAYCRYIGKMIWPANLAVLYPLPDHIPVAAGALGAIALIVVTLVVIRLRRRFPYLLVGWLWFVGTLVPVIGIVQVGAQAMADRYTYVPLIGLWIAIAWSAGEVARRVRWSGKVIGGMALVVLLAWAALTRAQLAHWKDSDALFAQALRVEPDNPIILNNIAFELIRAGRMREAAPYSARAVRLAKFPDAYSNLVVALAAENQFDQAMPFLEEGLTLFPNDSNLHRTAGVVYDQVGDLPRSYQHLAEAVRIDPGNIIAHQLLARVLLRLGRHDEALVEARRVVHALPDDPDSLFNLGSVLAAQHKPTEAAEQFRKVLAQHPDDADAHFHLALTLAAAGRKDESNLHLREALRLAPDDMRVLNNLAWNLATDPEQRRRDGAMALQLAQRAGGMPGAQQNAELLDTLAAAYAEAGQFDKAVGTADQAAAVAVRFGPARLAPDIRQRAQLYRQHQPFRDRAR